MSGGRIFRTVVMELEGFQAEMNLVDLRDKTCVLSRGSKAGHGSRWHWRGSGDQALCGIVHHGVRDWDQSCRSGLIMISFPFLRFLCLLSVENQEDDLECYCSSPRQKWLLAYNGGRGQW